MNELYPGHAEDQKRREDLSARLERAHSAVLPGALREAFAGSATASVAVSGASPETVSLQPVTLGLAANLERIKSPLLDVVRIMREVFSNPPLPAGEGRGEGESRDEIFSIINARVSKLKFEEEQIAETVFVFTRPQKRVRKLLEAGRAQFREAAMEELGDKLHPAQMAALQRACAQHYVASFATIIGYGSPPAEGVAVFPAPSPSAVTASAGG